MACGRNHKATRAEIGGRTPHFSPCVPAPLREISFVPFVWIRCSKTLWLRPKAGLGSSTFISGSEAVSRISLFVSRMGCLRAPVVQFRRACRVWRSGTAWPRMVSFPASRFTPCAPRGPSGPALPHSRAARSARYEIRATRYEPRIPPHGVTTNGSRVTGRCSAAPRFCPLRVPPVVKIY